MKKELSVAARWTGLVFLAALAVCLLAPAPGAAPPGPVYVIPLDEAITPATADYLGRHLKEAEAMAATCAIITLDTPGGLVESTRQIMQDIMASPVPVVVFVSPSGARAASAGTFITISADVAAMADGTNIGAAHPVSSGGEDIPGAMGEKVVNDLVANARSVAEKRGRNVEWVEQAIRESKSITATEALKKNVINMVAPDLSTLIEMLDGWKVPDKGVLHTRGAAVERAEETFSEKLLKKISNPNISYLLFLIGLAGLYFEFSNPGAVAPGVIGGISLVLAFYSFQTLPVNWAGVLLILLSVVFFFLEIKVTSYGALSIGGIVALVLGSLMLFDSPLPALRVSYRVMVPSVVFISAFFIGVGLLVIRAHVRQVRTGSEGLVGETGTVRMVPAENGLGKVFVHGEIWNARFDGEVAEGQPVTVERMEGLTLYVKRAGQADE